MIAAIRRALGLETRSSYSDLVLQQVTAQATTGGMQAAAEAGVQMAAGAIARMMALASVDGPAGAVLTPHVLSEVAFDLVRRGESVWKLDSDGSGRMELLRASVATVFGSPRRRDWTYHLTISGPTDTLTIPALAAEVVHVRVNAAPERRWRGVSPLGQASATGLMAQRLSASLGDELATAVVTILSQPQGQSEKNSKTLAATLADPGMRRLSLPETTMGGGGAGRASAPQSDWLPRKIQPQPHVETVKLYEVIQLEVAAVCGLPLALANPDAAGPAQREGWRQLLVGTVAPLGRLLEEEAARVLEEPVKLHHHEAAAVDAASRARAAKSIVEAQLGTKDEALRLVGWS